MRIKPLSVLTGSVFLVSTITVGATALSAHSGNVEQTVNVADSSGSTVSLLDGVPKFGNVFLIIGENTPASALTPTATPYIDNVLAPSAAWLTDYSATHDGSLSDYIAITSGQYKPCDTSDDFPYNVNTGEPSCAQNIDNLFHQLDVAGVSWTEWNESMPNTCSFYDDGTDWAENEYTTHHDPAVYYDDIEGGKLYTDAFGQGPSAECLQRVLPAGTTGPDDMSFFNNALVNGTVSQFNFVIPNDCENGHDPCGKGPDDQPGQFSAFLQREVPLIEASRAFGHNGLILITWDESGKPAHEGVGFLAIGPRVQPGTYTTAYDHYSLLRTLEDGFGISDHLAGAATAAPLEIWKR